MEIQSIAYPRSLYAPFFLYRKGRVSKNRFIAGLSGGNADLGESGRNGILLAVTSYNNSGGLDGTSIELLIRDDENEVASAEAATKDHMEQKVKAILRTFYHTLILSPP